MNKPIDNSKYLLLSTRKKNGSMVDTPVWFASDELYHYIFSAQNTGKVKRLRNFSDVEITPCSATGKERGESFATQGNLIDDVVVIKQAHQLLIEKYGWQMRLLDFFSMISGKYNQRAFIQVSKS